jgi:glycerophosphoryl diester phosphodiesterase
MHVNPLLFVPLAACVLLAPGLVYSTDTPNTQHILRVAHRGGAGLAPENTLAAFRKALELDADAVELDVHMSKDGALMVMHDPDLFRITGKVGEISALTLAELRRLNAAATYEGPDVGPQRIPTLQEVLALVQGHAGVQIEIKRRRNKRRYPGIEARVIAAVRQYNMLADAVVLSFDFSTLQKITALEPKMQTCALISTRYLSRFDVRQDAASVAADLSAHGFNCVGIKHTKLTTPLMRTLRAHGFRVGVWTVNEPASIRQFAEMGVDFITSDRPDLLREILP